MIFFFFLVSFFFFFNDTATTEIYTLSLHDALPIYQDQIVAPAYESGGGQRPARGHQLPQRHHGENTEKKAKPDWHFILHNKLINVHLRVS